MQPKIFVMSQLILPHVYVMLLLPLDVILLPRRKLNGLNYLKAVIDICLPGIRRPITLEMKRGTAIGG